MNTNLSNIIIKASKNDKASMMKVISLFSKQINTYSRKLYGDDTIQDLELFLIILIKRYAKRLKDKSNKIIVAYISRSLKKYSFHLYDKHMKHLSLEELEYEIPVESNYDNIIIPEKAFSVLTLKEKRIIFKIFYLDTPIKVIAKEYKVSVQSIYKIKNNALRKMRIILA